MEHTRYDINNGNIFHKALKKYGESNFKWEIIDTCTGLDQINKLEKYYIKKFNSYKPNGYNMTKGGDGGSMWNARPVVCLTLDGDFVKRYNSASEAKHDGFSDSNVLQCCKNILNQSIKTKKALYNVIKTKILSKNMIAFQKQLKLQVLLDIEFHPY